MGMKQKKKIKKKFPKWPTQKKLRFSKPPIFKNISKGLVLGLVGLIDAKGIDVWVARMGQNFDDYP